MVCEVLEGGSGSFDAGSSGCAAVVVRGAQDARSIEREKVPIGLVGQVGESVGVGGEGDRVDDGGLFDAQKVGHVDVSEGAAMWSVVPGGRGVRVRSW